MKKSPVHPNHETNDHNGDEYYDPYLDFSQFLEEAKRSERKTDFGIISSADTKEDVKRNPHQEEAKKKTKKAWKVFSLLPWWKGEKKSKPHMEQQTNFSHVSNTRRGGFASGPVCYSSNGKDTSGRPRRPTSGPLGGLFNPMRKADSKIRYVCLDQLNMPRCNAQTYGPVYLVT